MRSVPRAALAAAILLLLAPPSARAGFAPGGAFRGTNEDEVFRLLFPGWNPAIWLTPAGEGLKVADVRTWKDPTRKERLVLVVEHWKGDLDEGDRREATQNGNFHCDVAVLGGRKGAVTLIARAQNAVPCDSSTPFELDLKSYRMDSKTPLVGVRSAKRSATGARGLTLLMLDGDVLRPVLKVPHGATAGDATLKAVKGANGKNAFEERSKAGTVVARWEWAGQEYQRNPRENRSGS